MLSDPGDGGCAVLRITEKKIGTFFSQICEVQGRVEEGALCFALLRKKSALFLPRSAKPSEFLDLQALIRNRRSATAQLQLKQVAELAGLLVRQVVGRWLV
jgi:hypothetical protein